MSEGFLEDKKVIYLRPDGSGYTVSAGVTDVESDVVDMAGYRRATFIIGFGAVVTGSVSSVKVQQGAQSNLSDAADLLGTSQTVADSADNTLFVTQITNPIERYVRLKTLRATQNATINFLIAILEGARSRPVTSHASVSGREVHNSPIEGTA